MDSTGTGSTGTAGPAHALHGRALDLALLLEILEELLQGAEAVGGGGGLGALVQLVHERLDVLPADSADTAVGIPDRSRKAASWLIASR